MKKRVAKKGITICFILLFCCTCCLPSLAQQTEKKPLSTSQGDWLYVGGSGSGNYSIIQDAVDNASDGDMIFVYSGTYSHHYPKNRGCVDIIQKNINLIGENKFTTIIDAQNELGIIHIDANIVSISGFTLKNSSWFGVEIGFNWAHSVTVYNCIFDGCKGEGALVVWMGTNNIYNNTISNSTGIYFRNSKGSIYQNRIVNNSQAMHGIHLISSTCDIYKNLIVNNPQGIHASDSICNIYKNLFQGNGVGVHVESSHVVIRQNNFIKNDEHSYFSCYRPIIPIDRPRYRNNYWDDWNSNSPRPNKGDWYIVFFPFFLIDFPTWQYDWHPAQEPYDIPGITCKPSEIVGSYMSNYYLLFRI